MDKPAMALEWDAATQSLHTTIDHEQVKSLAFALALLSMAKSGVEQLIRQQQVMQMQAREADMHATRQLAKRIATN